jgi:hypothetical protein
MYLFIFTSLAFAVGAAPENSDNESKAAIKKVAQEMGDATVKGDFAKVFDYVYPAVVKKLGGRDKAIEVTEASTKKMTEKGLAIRKFKVGEPGDFYTEGDNVFVVVPTTVEMSSSAGRIIVKSYLLGISSDNKKSWKFVDGVGVSKEEARKQLLPKMPEKLELPQLERPQIVKEQ